MTFVALMSGGKDSLYSTLYCVRNGRELLACVHLGTPASETEELYMYHTAVSEVLPMLVEECLLREYAESSCSKATGWLTLITMVILLISITS